MTNKEEEKLLATLNKMIELCESITYDDFNKSLIANDVQLLRNEEAKNHHIGIARYGTPQEGISVMSIIATITSVLIGRRLCVTIDAEGIIKGFTFYEEES